MKHMTDSELTAAIATCKHILQVAPGDTDNADYLMRLELELDEREGCTCHHNDCIFHGSIDPQDHEY